MHHTFSTGKTVYSQIPKKQFTKGDGGVYSGYWVLQSDDSYDIYFNDNPINLSVSTGEKIKELGKVKESVFVRIPIDKNTGSVGKKVVIVDNSSSEFVVSPSLTFRSTDGKNVFYRRTKKEFQFGLLSRD